MPLQDTREAVDCRPTCEQRQGNEGLLPPRADAQQLPHLGPRALLHLSLVRAQCLQAGSRALVVWAIASGRQQQCVAYRDRAARASMNEGQQGGGGGGGWGFAPLPPGPRMPAPQAPPQVCIETTAGDVRCLPAHLHAEGVVFGARTLHQHTP